MVKKPNDLLMSEAPNLPNRFTVKLGKLVREARLEAKISQAELAKVSYLKQSSISRIEDGTRAVSAEEIIYLSAALNKPIGYLFPKEFTQELDPNELTVLERELLIQSRQLSRDDLRKLIAQMRAVATFKR